MPRCWIGPSSLPVTCSGRILPTSVRNAVGFASACFSTPNKRVSVTVATRNLAPYRDPAVIMIDQLKQVYIDGELNPIDTTQWYPMLTRKDYKVALNITETEVDDPDPVLHENYVCGAQRNYTGYCNPEVDKLVGRQSTESDILNLI